MSRSTHKENPPHGAKNTTDPFSRTDPKSEAAGPVPVDSLAAESLRAHGSFAAGNPVDISDDVPTAHIASEQARVVHHDTPEYTGLGAADRQAKEKVKESATLGGWSNARAELATDASVRTGLGASKYALSPADASGSKHAAGSTGKLESAKRQEDVDWSRIPKDTVPTTNIGGEDDPGRVAERQFAKRAARVPGARGTRGGVESGNQYDLLQEEGA